MYNSKPNITVTDLAAIAKCEQQFVYDEKEGEKRSSSWNRQAKEGQLWHSLEETRVRFGGGARDDRCFIASAVFGADAPETNVLRKWRDERLNRTAFGRGFISIYYKLSPSIAKRIEQRPVVKTFLRFIIKPFVIFAGGRS